MSRRHANNWSHPGHYLANPYTRPWSPNGHGHSHEWPTATPLCAMSIGPLILRYSYFKIWTWKSMVKVMCVVRGQGHAWPSKFKRQGCGQGQTHWSHLRPEVQWICLLFASWQLDHFWDIGNSVFDLENSRSRSWPRSNPMVIFEALVTNQYACFSFHGNMTIFGWDTTNSIFDLEISRSRSWPKWNPMVTF